MTQDNGNAPDNSEDASTEDTFNAEGGMNDQDFERGADGENLEGDPENTDQGGQLPADRTDSI